MPRRQIRVVGIGAREYGDDALGLHAADLLRTRLPSEVEVLTDTSGGANIPAICEGTDMIVIIDAVESTRSVPPGSVLVFSYPADRSAFQAVRCRNTHLFPLVEGLDLADRLGILPSKVLLCGMTGATFQPCTPLTPAVQTGLSMLVERVWAEIGSQP